MGTIEWGKLLKTMEIFDIAVVNMDGTYDEESYTKADVLDYFGPKAKTPNSMITGQYEASAFVVRNTPLARLFFKRWGNLISNFHLVSDEPSMATESPKFKENRHDQSLFSLLLKETACNWTWPCGQKLSQTLNERFSTFGLRFL